MILLTVIHPRLFSVAHFYYTLSFRYKSQTNTQLGTKTTNTVVRGRSQETFNIVFASDVLVIAIVGSNLNRCRWKQTYTSE